MNNQEPSLTPTLMTPTLRATDRLGQRAFEGAVIGVDIEDGQARVGAIQDVINQAAFSHARGSTHAARLGPGPNLVKESAPDPVLRSEVMPVKSSCLSCPNRVKK
jgi:hypothetical protein